MNDRQSQQLNHRNGLIPWYKYAVYACLVLWLLAAALPVWETQSERSGELVSVPGIFPALLGWFGIFVLCPAWLANIAIIPLCIRRWKRHEDFTFCFIACCTAASAYMMSALYDDAGANIITARYAGFYLWLGSFLVLLIGHAVLVSQLKKREPLFIGFLLPL